MDEGSGKSRGASNSFLEQDNGKLSIVGPFCIVVVNQRCNTTPRLGH